MEHIEKFVEEIISKKAKATNKDTMGDLVDLVLEKVKNLASGIYDPEAMVALKAAHADEVSAILKKAAEEQATLQEEIACYKSAIEALNKDVESYKEQLTQQDQETEDLRTQLRETQELLDDAVQQVNDTPGKAPQPSETTSASGKKVKVNFGVHLNGKQYSVADLVEDPEAIEELITIGSGSITLIEE